MHERTTKMPHIKSLFSKFASSLKSHSPTHAEHHHHRDDNAAASHDKPDKRHRNRSVDRVSGYTTHQVAEHTLPDGRPTSPERRRNNTMGNIFGVQNSVRQVMALEQPLTSEVRHPLFNNVVHKAEVREEYESKSTSQFYDDEIPAGYLRATDADFEVVETNLALTSTDGVAQSSPRQIFLNEDGFVRNVGGLTGALPNGKKLEEDTVVPVVPPPRRSMRKATNYEGT